MLLRRVGE